MNPLGLGLLGMLGVADKPKGQTADITNALGLGPMNFLQLLQHPSPFSVLGMLRGGGGFGQQPGNQAQTPQGQSGGMPLNFLQMLMGGKPFGGMFG